jgi:OOP family OmpA-OmpF porin
VVVWTGCTTTAILHEGSTVPITANRPAAPPPAPPPPPPPAPAEPARVQVEAERIRVDEKIHFELNSAEINSSSDGLLREIAQVMNANMHVKKVQVEGHTDNQGSAPYNQRLSQQRAESVVARLVQNGVDQSRLVARGFGLSRPIASNDTEEGKAQNRRVEFNILEQDPAPAAAAGAEQGAQTPAAGGGNP